MSKRLYVAYGSNLNFEQMKYRCPTAKLYDTGIIEGYELQFKGEPTCAFATIAPKENASVPVAVWEIQPRDEMALDRYEGYPSHYFKQNVPVQLGGEEVMVYIMNLKRQFGMPSPHYYQAVLEGYHDCGLDTDVLDQAVKDSAQNFYKSYSRRSQQQTLFDYADYGEEEPEDYDEEEELEENDEPELDESAPFYFSDGMHW